MQRDIGSSPVAGLEPAGGASGPPTPQASPAPMRRAAARPQINHRRPPPGRCSFRFRRPSAADMHRRAEAGGVAAHAAPGSRPLPFRSFSLCRGPLQYGLLHRAGRRGPDDAIAMLAEEWEWAGRNMDRIMGAPGSNALRRRLDDGSPASPPPPPEAPSPALLRSACGARPAGGVLEGGRRAATTRAHSPCRTPRLVSDHEATAQSMPGIAPFSSSHVVGRDAAYSSRRTIALRAGAKSMTTLSDSPESLIGRLIFAFLSGISFLRAYAMRLSTLARRPSISLRALWSCCGTVS